MNNRPLSPVFTFASRVVDELAARSPITAAYMGVDGHHHAWDDLSPEGLTAMADFWRSVIAEARGLTPQNTDDALALAVLGDSASDELERLEHADPVHDLNCIASTFQDLTRVFEHMPVETAEDGEAFRERLLGLPAAVRGFERRLRLGRERGQQSAQRQVVAALAQGRQATGPGSELRRLAARWPGPEMERALDGAIAALGGLCGWIEAELLPTAPAEDAVGAERYVRAAHQHLGDALDPLDASAWGWSEIRRIQGEIDVVIQQIQPGATLPEAVATLRADPRYVAPDADTFLTLMRERQRRALEALDGRCFDVPPPARELNVRLAPEGGPIGAYYSAPSEDFSRPGTVWYLLERREHIPFFAEVSTAHHEGFPGHHLHISAMRWQAEHLSRFQRLAAHGVGHLEGWALYAERLMRELGYLEEPAFVLGMLTCELVRAWRVVIDIGCHLKLRVPLDSPWRPGETWDFALAAEALERQAMLAPGAARSNALRYLGWPGQAISYKLGERVVLDLREEAKAAQHQNFDLKRFHAAVVGCGSLGLARLRTVVRERLAEPAGAVP